MFFLTAKNEKNLYKRKGFTLYEAVIAMAIFIILTGVVLLRHNQFQGSVLITNLAYDVALSLRQAQIYGVSVREDTGAATTELSFQSGYGIHFDNVPENKQYLLFADAYSNIPPVGRNNKYDGVAEILQTNKIKGGSFLSDVCVFEPSLQIEHCFSDVPPTFKTLDITFQRPQPEAILMAYDGSGNSLYNSGLSTALIKLETPSGVLRCVRVETTGQISVVSDPALCVFN